MAARVGKRKLPPPPIPRSAKRPDWPWIRREWEADLKSTRAISTQSTIAGKKVSHVAIEKRAKKEGWKKKALSAEVQREIANRLASAAVTTITGDHASTEDVVDAAAREGVSVVQMHRKDIRTARELVKEMVEQLKDATFNVADLEAMIAEETKASPDAKEAVVKARVAQRARLMRTIGLQSRAGVAKDLSHAMRNLIWLERQAYNIDARHQGSTLEDHLKSLED